MPSSVSSFHKSKPLTSEGDGDIMKPYEIKCSRFDGKQKRGDFMKHLFDFDINKISVEDLRSNISREEIPDKDKIVAFLRSFSPVAYSSAPVVDKLDGTKTKYMDNLRQCGDFRWSESEIYHFEKYNLKANEDFIQCVFNQIKEK